MGRISRAKERLGIFGGTFDPPHVGHQILAMEAFDQLKLDKVLWVLAPAPPHKLGKKISSLEVRIEMVRAAIDGDEIFEFSSVDIDRPGPHYVLDTMRILREQRPGAELVFLMGGDSLHDLPTWHEPEAFIAACDSLGVMHRPGEVVRLEDLEKCFPGLSAKVEFIEAPLLEISSNQIRSLAIGGNPFRYYLPFEVYKIVEARNLYQKEH